MKAFLLLLATLTSVAAVIGIVFQVYCIVVNGKIHVGLFFPVLSITVLCLALWLLLGAVKRHGVQVLHTWGRKE